jgi:uncharacterized membrane protein
LEPPTSTPTTDRRTALWQLAIVATLIGVYALISQYGYSNPENQGVGAGLSIGPVALIAIALAWRWTPRWLAAALTLLIAALVYFSWPFLKAHYEWSDLVQQAGAFTLVAFGFGRSLIGDRIPTCTLLADKLHGPLTDREIVYTRRATYVWCSFYVLLTGAIVALFFAAPAHTWSLFVNFGTFGLMGLLFVADHALRYRVLPRRPGGGLVAALLQSVTGSRKP